MSIYTDKRIVMTLDAGGTNFVFSAIQGGEEIVDPIIMESNAHNLDQCLRTIITGFEQVKSRLPEAPIAISFAFPGPADYRAGIIGKLPNLPAFKDGGIALGPMLEDYFKLPTFIGNDGNLFAYAEAMAGALPYINGCLFERNVSKRYSNLLGITLGTGFGAGLVVNNTLCEGDNFAGGEIWLSRSIVNPAMFAEAQMSTKAIQMAYAQKSGNTDSRLMPKDISEIAQGIKPGNRSAALEVFNEVALVIAESLCHAVTLIDGIIVIGGGISGAYSLLIPKIIEHMNGTIQTLDGRHIPRLVSKVYDLEDKQSFEQFLSYKDQEVEVPFSNRKVPYESEKRIGIIKSRIGTNRAISIGAYTIALHRLPQHISTAEQDLKLTKSSIL
ncbi:ROK family protein [Chryseosolibacter indicus]|uniref:ROK family protein n=1 Tax=Chryseosolibacter indicus TaxID=2782351 RepID=A0ABS5VW31_9BACT|nr:ROK family protein [Chryseosolibacter indicus]MBT1705642.1 ROK family protein [Chryseosolibacter indicus]